MHTWLSIACLTFGLLSFRVHGQIIPTYEWVSHIGDTTNSQHFPDTKVGTDAAGSVITSGHFFGTIDFDPGPGTSWMTSLQSDVYIQKLDSNGNFLWVRKIGGFTHDKGYELRVEPNGDIFVAGTFTGTVDLDPGAGTHIVSSNGVSDAFLVKLDANGNHVWSTRTGGLSYDRYFAVTTDPMGNVIVGGDFMSDSLDLDPGTGYLPTGPADSTSDLFIQKFDPNGNFLWGKALIAEGANNITGNTIYGMEADAAGNIYFAGRMYDTIDFDPDTGVYNVSVPINSISTTFQGYVCKFSPGGQLIWADVQNIGFQSNNYDMELDPYGNVVVVGLRGVCTAWNGNLCQNTSSRSYVQKLDPNGAVLWDKALGGNWNWLFLKGVATDDLGHIYISGAFRDSIDLGNGVVAHAVGTDRNGAIARLNPNGLAQWVYPLEGGSPSASNYPYGTDVEVGNGKVLVSGRFSNTVDFDAGPNTAQENAIGWRDYFVLQVENTCASFTAINDTACNSYTTPSGSTTHTFPGTYFDVLTNAQGCDSILQISLTLTNIQFDTVVACGSYVLPGGTTATTSGTYIDTVVTSGGSCDSIRYTYLTIHPVYVQNLNVVGCDSFVTPSGQVITASGTHTDTLQSAQGCDSIVTYTVTIHPTAQTMIFPVTCDLYFTPGGQWANVSGVYADTLLTTNGCDSVVIYDLTVHYSAQTTQNAVACDSFLSPGGQWLFSSGQFLDTLQTVNGCDSVITTNLTVLQSTSATMAVSVCESYASPSGNFIWNASGTYWDTIHNSAGCDSVITINLTVLGFDTDTIALAGCGSVTTPGGQVVITSGWYLDSLTNANGCDSLVWTEVVIEPEFTTLIVDTICNPPYITPGGNEYGITGTYVETYTAQNGCDSTVTYQLEIGQVLFWVAISGQSITAVAPLGSTFQWLDCNQNMAPVPGADSASLPVLQFQNYAVVVTQGFCSDTSECILTESLTIGEESTQNGLNVYPNPNRGQFTIELIGSQSADIEVVNPMGQVILRERMSSSRSEVLLDHPAAGTYWIRFLMDGEWRAVPVVVD